MIKKKILIITINKTVIDVFLTNHVEELSNKFQIEFYPHINLIKSS